MKPDLHAILAEAQALHQQFSSLLLATVSATDEPLASYAPYVIDDEGGFCIYVSELAGHTGNLLSTGKASVLFIEDESHSRQIFARKRLTFDCSACEIDRGSPTFEALMDAFDIRHGHIMSMLRSLRDFHLFRLQPTRAVYVRGFGEAFTLEGELLSEIHWINERGHSSVPYPA